MAESSLYDRYRIFIRSRLITTDSDFFAVYRMRLIAEVTDYIEFDAIARHNDVGTWTLSIPMRDEELVAKIFGTSLDQYATGSPAGKGIVVYLSPAGGGFTPDNQDPVFSGPITAYEKKYDDKDDSGDGTLVLSGVSDDIIWAERLIWPLGDRDIHAQHDKGRAYYLPQFDHFTESNAASAILNDPAGADYYNSLVCGHVETVETGDNPPQNAAEVIAGLVAGQISFQVVGGSDPERAQQKAYRHRSDVVYTPPENAGDIQPDASVGLVGQDLVFTSLRTLVATLGATYDTQLRFLWKPRTRTHFGFIARDRIHARVRTNPNKVDTIRFGKSFGNVSAYSYSVTAPSKTRWVLGAAGKGTARYYALGQDRDLDPPGWSDPNGWSASEREWGRNGEDFIDRSDIAWAYKLQTSPVPPDTGTWAQDPARGSLEQGQMAGAFSEQFADNGSGSAISFDVLDTPKQRYGRDYELGDRVMVEVDGFAIEELIREVRFTDNAEDGLRIRPTVGDAAATTTPALYKQIRKLWRQLTGSTGLESSTFDKLSIGFLSPDNNDPKNGSFTITGSSSESGSLAGATVKLMWRSTPGHSKNWAYYSGMVTATDSAGNWSFPGVITDFGASYTVYKVEITRITDNQTVQSGNLYIPAAKSGTKLEDPDVIRPDDVSAGGYRPGAGVRVSGYAPPRSMLEIQHRVSGVGSFVNAEIRSGTSRATDAGWVDFKIRALEGAFTPGTAGVVEVRYRVVHYDDDGFQWVSDWQGTLDNGHAAGYFVNG